MPGKAIGIMESVLFPFVLPLSSKPLILQPGYYSGLGSNLFPFCPHKVVISVWPKGYLLDHKLNVTLLLKACHHLSALGLISKFLTIVYKELSSSCFSLIFRLIYFVGLWNTPCIFQISCFTHPVQ